MPRLAISLLFLLVAAAPPLAPGAVAPVSRLAPDSEARWVPFALTPGNQIRFTMTLDGKPVTAILDTGVSYSVLARGYVKAAKLKVAQSGSATAIGGVVPIGWVATHSLSLGGLTRTGGEITVADLPTAATGGTVPIDILIGPDLLGEYALDVDYDAKRFRLLPTGRLPFRGISAPLHISPDRQIYMTELTLGGRRLRPIVVDTGDGSTVTVSTEAWHAAEPVPPKTTSAISFGLGGTIETALAIVPLLAVGDLTAREIEVRIEGVGGFSQTIGAQGRIGSGFLQRYRVLLDPGAGRMVFSPGATADAPPVRSTSGLLLGLEGSRLRVLHVMRGGPGAATGWRRDDTICSVDGAAVTSEYRHHRIADWSIGAPGRVVTLGMCDGSERTLTLKNFY